MGNKNYTKYSENSKNNKTPIDANELLDKLTTNETEELDETIKEGLEAGVNNEEVQNNDNNELETNNNEDENNDDDKNDENEDDNDENQNNNNELENNNNEDENNDDENQNSANDEIVNAVVTGCNKLYVREQPSKESNHLCIIENGTELTVNLTESTDTFYKVHTCSGETLIAGYCVKEFISIK